MFSCARRPRRSLSGSAGLDHRARIGSAPALFKGGRVSGPERLPSVRSSTSRSRQTVVRSLVRSRLPASHPFARSGRDPVSRGPPRRATHPPPSPTFRPTSVRNGKMLLTDFCNRPTTRALADRSILESTSREVRPDAAIHRLVGAEAPCGDSTSSGSMLDGALPTSAARATALLDSSRASRMKPLRRGVVDRVQSWCTASDAPFARAPPPVTRIRRER